MNDLDKLRILLPHWIEHNTGHGREFAKWAQTLAASGETDIAGLLTKAAVALQDAESNLLQALKKAGGPLEGHDDHHHSPE